MKAESNDWQKTFYDLSSFQDTYIFFFYTDIYIHGLANDFNQLRRNTKEVSELKI